MPSSIATDRSRFALFGLILAVSMTTIDQTIVALSAPAIEASTGMTSVGISWAVNAYLLATAATLAIGGRLADLWGARRMALIGTAAFGAASLLCGLTPTGPLAATWLISARVLQGIAGALLFPAAVGLVVAGVRRERRGRAMATFFAATGAMTAVGPIAGGYLTAWTWRSIFWVNIPIAVAAFTILLLTATHTPGRRGRLDWRGALLLVPGMSGAVLGLQQAASWGWSSPAVWGSMLVGLTFLSVFYLHVRGSSDGLLNARVFANRSFRLSVLAVLLASVAFMPVFYFLSVYGQVSLNLSATSTGLLFLKLFIGFVIASRIGSGMYDRSGNRRVLLIGGLLGTTGFVWLSLVTTTLPVGVHLFDLHTWPILLAGAGIGFMFSAANTDAVNQSPHTAYGEIVAITQTMRNFGGAVGMAVLTTLVHTVLGDKITASLTALGATPDRIAAIKSSLAGTQATAANIDNVPASLHNEIQTIMQHDSAAAISWAFLAMAVVMAAIAAISFFYPKTNHTGRDDTQPRSDRRYGASVGASTPVAMTSR